MNDLLLKYQEYSKACFDKHEDQLPFKRWLKEVYNPPVTCSKCRRMVKTLLEKSK